MQQIDFTSSYSDMREINKSEILPKENNGNQACWRAATVKEERDDNLMATNGNVNSINVFNKPVDSLPDDNLGKATPEENDTANDYSVRDRKASISDYTTDQALENDDNNQNVSSGSKDEDMDDVDNEEAYDANPKLISSIDNDVEDLDEEEAYDGHNDIDLNKMTQHDGDDYEDDDDDNVPSNTVDDPDENLEQINSKPDIWTLPAKREDCSLEEIRRGQVINGMAPNECPVIGCGKKINENRIEPSPGTIASGLRTHVLFVHYENRRANKKRKLGWSTKRKTQTSPRKQSGQLLSPSTSGHDYDLDNKTNDPAEDFGLNLMKNSNSPANFPRYPSSNAPGSLINKKVKQLAAKQSLQMSSLQSLMQATGSNVINLGSQQQTSSKQKVLETNTSHTQNNNLNPTTSSLFSILAGLTQPQLNQQAPISKNIKTAHGTNTINISSCSRSSVNNINNNNNTNSSKNNSFGPAVNSSLLSLLNEKISGNVASSLQTQLKKTLAGDTRTKISTPSSRQKNSSAANNSYFQANNDPNFNNSSSILSSLCLGNGDTRTQYDNSIPLNSFIESIAIKTGSNIGQSGIAEAKKIIEKFTVSLICSSQTIADHYLAPFSGEVPQQKPEISPSDIMLAYKMMHKSHSQP